MFGRSWPFRAHVRNGIIQSWPHILAQYNDEYSVPCTNDEVSKAWLNNEEVRKAIHAEPINVSVIWELCTDRVRYTHDSGSMIPYHKNLTLQNYRVLIFSGDHDMCVPYTGSEAWTQSLGYKTVDEWRPWLTYDNQVAGYVQGYDNNLTFLTIKGAGHTVPEYKPREALDFYSRWLEGKPI
ncbi:Carboxypeptidase [Quillaja saponaria]|uniref:Carboxypeptidase n=1 Tax=Quillaja saponaria TaxID=32244 RepID=A0AAD7PDB3_QUISA|nr:Carboxypeptidase [Quillaja saponaria]